MILRTQILPLAGLLFVAAAMPAYGAAPNRATITPTKYQKLWTQSPFTVKPPPPNVEAGPGPLEDYTLASVSPSQEGWFVVLLNKKKREDRVRIVPGTENEEGFKVVEVKQDPASYKETKVKLAYRGDTGWLGYEDKYLALKRAAGGPAKAVPPRPGTPARPAVPTPAAARTPTPPPSPTNQASPATTRQPRVRRVPTPPTR